MDPSDVEQCQPLLPAKQPGGAKNPQQAEQCTGQHLWLVQLLVQLLGLAPLAADSGLVGRARHYFQHVVRVVLFTGVFGLHLYCDVTAKVHQEQTWLNITITIAQFIRVIGCWYFARQFVRSFAEPCTYLDLQPNQPSCYSRDTRTYHAHLVLLSFFVIIFGLVFANVVWNNYACAFMNSLYLFATFGCDVIESKLSFVFCAIVYARVARLRAIIVKLRSDLFDAPDMLTAMNLHQSVCAAIKATSVSLEEWFLWVLCSTTIVVVLTILNQSLALASSKAFSEIFQAKQGTIANFDDYAMVLIPIVVYSTMERWWLRQISRPLNLTPTDKAPAHSVFRDRTNTDLFLNYHDRSLHRRTLRVYDYQIVFKTTFIISVGTVAALGLRFFTQHKGVITKVLHA